MDADPTAAAVAFARTLRGTGVAAGTGRVRDFLAALAVLDAARRDDVYWAGRLTLCANHDDIEHYDRAFAAFFSGALGKARTRTRVPPRPVVVRVPSDAADAADEGGDRQGPLAPSPASRTEVLRQRDFSALNVAQRAELEALLSAFTLPGELRRTRRLRPARRGRVDRARTVRRMLRQGGEPTGLRHHTRSHRPRRVVLLVDVSGSMSAYADALLRFAHAAARRKDVRTEVFTVGTRLTRVTGELGQRDPDSALAAVSATIPDWNGGTRLGELLKEFCDRWGQRGLARGAVVVVLSDGWERDDPALLGEQTARLARLAHRLVWANPLKARRGYEPLAAGMAAALPYVDDFVEGHSLAALERLAAVVAGRTGGARA